MLFYREYRYLIGNILLIVNKWKKNFGFIFGIFYILLKMLIENIIFYCFYLYVINMFWYILYMIKVKLYVLYVI